MKKMFLNFEVKYANKLNKSIFSLLLFSMKNIAILIGISYFYLGIFSLTLKLE